MEMKVLDCFNNNFAGPLPGGLWNIATLAHLSLGGNYFEGSIPSQYGSFPALKYLGLNGNSLTGAIPSELGKLQGNKILLFLVNWFDNERICTMSRNLKPCFSSVRSPGLEELYMGYFNNYSSGIPASFGNLTSLVRLDMGRCGLTGTIPPELGNLGKLDTLFLQLNNLVGVIPVQIGNIVNLQSLDLSYNNLSGIIPPALIYLQKLELLSLMSNNFEGGIPDFIGDMPNLQVGIGTKITHQVLMSPSKNEILKPTMRFAAGAVSVG